MQTNPAVEQNNETLNGHKGCIILSLQMSAVGEGVTPIVDGRVNF